MTNDEIEQAIYAKTRRFVDGDVLECIREMLAAQPAAQEPSDEQIVDLACRTLTRWEQDPIKFARAVLALRAQPAAQEPEYELLREWIEAIGVNPDLNRWHVSREDVLQLIRLARP